jgi:hypothetical protein
VATSAGGGTAGYQTSFGVLVVITGIILVVALRLHEYRKPLHETAAMQVVDDSSDVPDSR